MSRPPYEGFVGVRNSGPNYHAWAPLKGLSHEIDFKNVDEKSQILALIRAAAGF